MGRKRLILALFLVSVFLTIFVNFTSFNPQTSRSGSGESNYNTYRRISYTSEIYSSSISDSKPVKPTSSSSSLLAYRINRPNYVSSVVTDLTYDTDNNNNEDSSKVSNNHDNKKGTDITVAFESVDDEKILNSPLNLPQRNNSINCTSSMEHALEMKTIRRASFTIIVNYVAGNRRVKCDESITYTTHGDYRFMDNLVPLAERWQGPISIALYAPLGDLKPTIDRIIYLRECTSPLIKEWVTFHIFGDTKYFEDPMPYLSKIFNVDADSLDPDFCLNEPEFDDHMNNDRTSKNLLYPVNVARNVARQAAMTHYVLASDIELYPSLNIIPMFMDMLYRNDSQYLGRSSPRIFTLPVFEIASYVEIPHIKYDLVKQIQKKQAFSFHRKICSHCHRIPRYTDWIHTTTMQNDQLNIFHVTKRLERYKRWEPIFIGTNNDPLFDERLSWEGLKDKMTQNYILCVLDYDYMILDNAYLVHKPGIKVKKHPKKPDRAMRKQKRIFKKIYKELNKLYGTREGCEL